MWEMLLKPISDVVNKVVDKIAPDAGFSEKLKSELNKELLTHISTVLSKQSDVVLAEAKGESWLQRNWRPLIMVNFAVLITAHWLGFTPENLSEAQVLALLDIVEVGIGGYIVGRSVEKSVKAFKGS